MTVNTLPISITRSRRDLVTNPAFEELTEAVNSMVDQEIHKLALDSRGSELHSINYQSGIVDGIKRVLLRMENFRDDGMGDFRGQSERDPGPESEL